MFRLTELSIAAISVVCLGLFGCGGDGDSSSGGAVGGGSGKVVSCDVKTSQAGYEAESCTEVPESSPAAEPFRQSCGSQNAAGVTTATVGSGCPAAQKKCTIGEQTIYYYGEAANYAQCADVGDVGNGSGLPNSSGSSDNSGSAQTGNGKVSFLYVETYLDETTSYCNEFNEGASEISDETLLCDFANAGTDSRVQTSCKIGAGCPASTKVCSYYGDGLRYYYGQLEKGVKCSD